MFCVLAAFPAHAQEKRFPSRPIDIIVNFGPGSGADKLGRVMSRLLEPVLGLILGSLAE